MVGVQGLGCRFGVDGLTVQGLRFINVGALYNNCLYHFSRFLIITI